MDHWIHVMYHIKCMWFSDLHFMVQWFWISWRLLCGGILYWRYWFSATFSLTYKCICRTVTYSSWYSDSALYKQYYLMNKPHSSDIGSVWYGPLTCISWFMNFESFTYFLPIVVCWSLIKNICECSKVRNRPVVYSRRKVGASVYFGHISSFPS